MGPDASFTRGRCRVVDWIVSCYKVLVFFGGAGEQKGVGDRGLALGDCGDDIGAAEPVRFGEVGGGPLRGVVGVGVVEAGDLEALRRASRSILTSSMGAI